MTSREPTRPTGSTILAMLVAGVAVTGVLISQSPSSSTAPSVDSPRVDDHGPAGAGRPPPPPRERASDRATRSGVAAADGGVPDGVTVFDDDMPAVAKLDPDLLAALRRAATDAEHGGVRFVVNSGWRSPAYQQRLLREAVSEHGSEAAAARWVATADKSLHVSGDAVDVGPPDAAGWLSEHGAEYGLCRVYGNEPWHFELRPEAKSGGCPPVYADPTRDPRMRP